MANLLGHPKTSIDTISRALGIYDAIRRPFSQRTVELSRENARLFSLSFPGLTNDNIADRRSEKLQELHGHVRDNWEWCWTTTIDADLQQAMAVLEG